MFQHEYIAVPYPSDLNPMPAYDEYIDEIARFPVLFERQMEQISRDYDLTIARLLNSMLGMFNMVGLALDGDRWMLKMADAAAGEM